MKRYRATWRGSYLFHCYGWNDEDAQAEARNLAARTMRQQVVEELQVKEEVLSID